MNKNEEKLFWHLCSFLESNGDSMKKVIKEAATPEVLGQLFFNRMQGVAYGVLKQANLLHETNREFRNSLAGAWKQNVQKNESFYQCVEKLSDDLRSIKDKYVMLKGALLCGIYPDGYRTSNDIDLLVRPEDVTEIGKALLQLGFRQGSIRDNRFIPASRQEIIESKMMRGETVPYILEVDLPWLQFLEVDINFSLDYKPGDDKALCLMLERSTAADVRGANVSALNRMDFFIHLCAHLYKEATTLPWVQMRRDMTLYKFSDIYLLMSQFSDSDVRQLFDQAKELGMQEICSCVILWTIALYEICSPYIQEHAEYILAEKVNMLHTVFAPSEHKELVYTEMNMRRRFFNTNRLELLSEVQK